MEKLQNTVSKCRQDTGLNSVKVSDQTDAEHGKQSNRAAVGHFKFDVGQNEAKSNQNAAKSKALCTQFCCFLFAADFLVFLSTHDIEDVRYT